MRFQSIALAGTDLQGILKINSQAFQLVGSIRCLRKGKVKKSQKLASRKPLALTAISMQVPTSAVRPTSVASLQSNWVGSWNKKQHATLGPTSTCLPRADGYKSENPLKLIDTDNLLQKTIICLWWNLSQKSLFPSVQTVMEPRATNLLIQMLWLGHWSQRVQSTVCRPMFSGLCWKNLCVICIQHCI